ncbi:MAG: hypothetical protein N2690_12235, partial [Rhodocyclaceae bacterium]|nr:hypothetical protein [Rhodocyclaceae bacterium]
AEESATQAAQGEGKAPRAEAAVKGITPEQPAPTVAPEAPPATAEKPGLFARILAWFSGGKAAPAAPVETKKPERAGR